MEENIILKPGDKGRLVNRLQLTLGLEKTGNYDRLTEAAVKNLQAKLDNVYPSGIVDKETWDAIFGPAIEEETLKFQRLIQSISTTTDLLKDIDTELHELSVLLKKYIHDFISEKSNF